MPTTPAAAVAPLRHSAFRALWIASLASNTGLWIQNTGASWLMTSFAPSPVMVSLVQAATMLPVFLFALPGGALADILDRRRTLIAAQTWIATDGLILAASAAVGLLGPWGLLALTFMIGAGTAVIFPAWAAATPELVPREDLVQAIALNGVGFNLARTRPGAWRFRHGGGPRSNVLFKRPRLFRAALGARCVAPARAAPL